MITAKNRLVKACKRVILLVCFMFSFSIMGLSSENVVQLPYFDNIQSFITYYWQQQHILAQGTIFEDYLGLSKKR